MSIRSNKLLALALTAVALTFSGQTFADSASANIVTAVNANPDLSTFGKLIKQAGMDSALEANGPVTVFAPSDAAFKNVPAATMDKLAKDPELLKATLGYHIVPGLVKSSSIEGAMPLTTSTGAKMAVSKAGEFVTVDDGLVVKADVPAGNGVIHVIDTVLTPPKK
ncbi:MAG: fasciclin domain-containing protein [Aquabacterium sp.]